MERRHRGTADTDEKFMRRALALAARAAGETNPNPMVGCVVVKAGRIVGEGFHRRAGGPHAEIVALARAGARARGSTLYLNLEPCSHEGRTPPCAPRLVGAGVRRVVAAMRDPDPRVDGRGFALLRRAGMEVVEGVLQERALLLNERFVTAAQKGRPFVLLKAAMTLDGRIATAAGESKWITSPQQRREARRLRRLHDAVVVGIGTVLADDPMLLPEPMVDRPFYRVVIDGRLRLPLRSRLVRSARRTPVIVLCHRADRRKQRALAARGVRVLPVPSRQDRVSLRGALRALAREGITSVMVEGGSELLGSFLRERLCDEVALFRAPTLLGGRHGLPAFGGTDPRRLSQALRLSRRSPLLRGTRHPGDGDHLELWYPT